jgi:hypothetical protein
VGGHRVFLPPRWDHVTVTAEQWDRLQGVVAAQAAAILDVRTICATNNDWDAGAALARVREALDRWGV